MNFFRKHRKWVSIFVLVAIVVASSVIAVNVLNPGGAEACRDQGCNVVFWKDHTTKWVGHNPSDTVITLFSGADKFHLGDSILISALGNNWNYCDNTPAEKAAKALLKVGIAARLNVSNPAIDYHVSGGTVTKMVNDALASGNIVTMESTQNLLHSWNNAGCPLNP
jgi:hypothetical protein